MSSGKSLAGLGNAILLCNPIIRCRTLDPCRQFPASDLLPSKVDRHCDRVGVGTLTDALSGWDATIDWYGNILVVRRVLDEVGLSSTCAIPPNDGPGRVQIQVVVQRLASLEHSPRIE
jgi:hypothetical protein